MWQTLPQNQGQGEVAIGRRNSKENPNKSINIL